MPRFLLACILAVIVTANAPTARAAGPDLPDTPLILPGYSVPDSVTARLSRLPLDAIEGLWQYTDEGSLIAVVARHRRLPSVRKADITGIYDVIVVNSADRAIRPGTIVGTIVRAGRRASYQARFYSKISRGTPTLGGHRDFTINLDPDGAYLTFKPRNGRFSINLLAILLPPGYRYTVRQSPSNRPDRGCVRIFPLPDLPVEPRYL